MRVGANVEPFATKNAEVDIGQCDAINAVAVDMNKARLALDDFSLPRKFVERDAAMLFRRDHRRHLVKIAPEFFEGRANVIVAQIGHRLCLDDRTLSILRVGRRPECKCADIFLVFAHQQVLHFCSAPDR